MDKKVTFGTSGHRGVIGKTFTIKQVEAIAYAVADFVHSKNGSTIALGYDPRHGNSPSLANDSFTKTIVDVITNAGIDIHIFDSFTPTPLVSWYITNKNIAGGLILTASHNPAEYNGLKFNPENGAPAPPMVTALIEETANQYLFDTIAKTLFKKQKGSIQKVNAEKEFSSALKYTIESMISKPVDTASVKVAIDTKHGACASTWDTIFNLCPVSNYKIFHSKPWADFANIEPNPTKFDSLSKLKSACIHDGFDMAIANDPDGDRHVILDEQGHHLIPEETTLIILDYLLSQNCMVSGIISTIASSQIIKKACEHNHLSFQETSVGFKYFAKFLQDEQRKNKIALAVESSGGFSISNHTLEKCGFLPGLIIAHIISETKTPLSQLKQMIIEKYGTFIFMESEFNFDHDAKHCLIKDLKAPDVDALSVIFDQKINHCMTIDGLKLYFHDDSWVLMRLSGTEPLARIYAEASSTKKTNQLLDRAKCFLQSSIETSALKTL